ncbi:Cullin-domain-containing protein [Obba rivulosa]|uniref:Cullin-domain-containing protein n=1 Tax=Obba rivulosa TaxID=1052685 RepID=A0A8E2DQY7_9APHY|nr:Cullin-domain-containing protein [Obba rivulosa]
MTDVYTLFTLPQTSNAFTAFRSTVGSYSEPGSASPPRKIARLADDSDSASASRSRVHAVAGADGGRPISITIIGSPAQGTGKQGGDDLALVRRCVRVLLDKSRYEPLPATYEQVYRACRTVVCVYGQGDTLFETVKLELEKCVNNLANGLLQDKRLDAFIETCAWFEKQIGLLESMVAYLDRLYVANKKDIPETHALAYSLFEQRIFQNVDIVNRLQSNIQEWVTWERKNGAQHPLRDRISVLIKHLQRHGQYHNIFELFYLDLTQTFYLNESQACVEDDKMDAKTFVRHCENRRDQEQQRAKEVLPEGSLDEILAVTDKSLLTDRLDWLAKGALKPLIESKSEGALKMMYRLFARVDGLKLLCAAWKAFVQSAVKTIVTDAEHDEEMVPRLLDFKAFADRLVAYAFVDEVPPIVEAPQPHASSSKVQLSAPASIRVPNQEFGYALMDAFAVGFKARRNKPAEMIAKHLDRAMRKGQKGRKDEDFEAELDAMLGLYRFTDDKDVFRTFYHRALAKRLLLERSASDDFEKAMLKKLKEQYDPEFGMGDHMFTDLALSRDLMREYIDHRARLGDSSYAQKLSVMVLQRSFWPFAARKHDIDLAVSMQEELKRYSDFYKSKHQGRKLDWDHSLGTATLKARFDAGEKELSVSLYQAAVLLLFNEGADIAFPDIKAQTRMEDVELRRTLQSLACGKKRVLKKQPPGKDVNDGDTFQFNADFTDPRYQVHINSIQVKETPEESKRTQTLIEGDRKHALDAAIVRIMKARKELSYQQLTAATVEAVKNHFKPDVSSIKQRIQSLVEQEYLRRDEEDMNKYIYVA